MPRNGSGTMTRNNGVHSGASTWANDRDAGDNILVSRHDAHDEDIANEITNSIAKDGQTTPTADLPMGGFKHSNVGNASLRTHYAATGQVQDGSFVWGGSSTGAANTYSISVSPAISAYVSGQGFSFESHQTNTGAATLNINGNGATPLKVVGSGGLIDPPSGAIQANAIVHVIYTSTGGGQFCVVGAYAGKNIQDISGLSNADGNFVVGDGSAFVAESGATARASLGAAQSGANSDITSLTNVTSVTGTGTTFSVGNQNVSGDTLIVFNNSNKIRGSGNNFGPETSISLNLGDSSRKWASADLSGSVNADSGFTGPSFLGNYSSVSVGSTNASGDLQLNWENAVKIIGSGIQFRPNTVGTMDLGNDTNYWSRLHIKTIKNPAGNVQFLSNIAPNVTSLYTSGTSSLKWNEVWSNSFLPFTGCHYVTKICSDNPPEIGHAVSIDDEGFLRRAKKGEGRVCGIYQGESESGNGEKIYLFAAVGDNRSGELHGFTIYAPGRSVVPAGSALCVSEHPGVLKAQDDGIIRTTTVGKTFVDAVVENDYARDVYGAIFCG